MSSKTNRRDFLRATAAAGVLATDGIPALDRGQDCMAKDGTVRDRFWLFAAPANTDFPSLGRRSVMTPAEGAYYLSIPNLIMVQSGDEEVKYGRFEPPLEQYAVALRPFKRVVWWITGSGGVTSLEERNQVLGLAKRTSNFAGVYMDDFFEEHGKVAALSLEDLRGVRQQLKTLGRDLKSWVTFYTRQLDLPIVEYLRLIDVITLWTWKPADLVNLESNLKKVEELAPHSKRALGCYMVDYKEKASVPIAAMKQQCEAGLEWLRQGRIEGVVFLGNTVEDLDFEAVEWTREWIRKVGETKL